MVSIIGGADNAGAAAHALLRVGAQAARVAASDLNTDLVERRFAGLASGFDAKMSEAVDRISTAADQLLDEETGTLPKTLAGLRAELEHLLGNTFDPDSKTSVIAKIESLVTQNADYMARNVKAGFDLDQPTSPLARTKREISELVKDQASVLSKQVGDIAAALAAKSATAAVADKLTSKGTTFEDLVSAGLDRISVIHGDVVNRVGTRTGPGGTKRGDLTVTICPDDTFGTDAHFVIEAKDRALSMSKTLAELDAAMDNHQAAAAIAVFARADLSPVSIPFWCSGSRAILVYDKEDTDPRALQLAYQWARWTTRRSLVEAAQDSINPAHVDAAIARVRQALTKHQSVKVCLSAIKNKADEAANHVAGLLEEIDHAMRDLVDLTRRAT